MRKLIFFFFFLIINQLQLSEQQKKILKNGTRAKEKPVCRYE